MELTFKIQSGNSSSKSNCGQTKPDERATGVCALQTVDYVNKGSILAADAVNVIVRTTGTRIHRLLESSCCSSRAA